VVVVTGPVGIVVAGGAGGGVVVMVVTGDVVAVVPAGAGATVATVVGRFGALAPGCPGLLAEVWRRVVAAVRGPVVVEVATFRGGRVVDESPRPTVDVGG
jgi:hypothetical protein